MYGVVKFMRSSDATNIQLLYFKSACSVKEYFRKCGNTVSLLTYDSDNLDKAVSFLEYEHIRDKMSVDKASLIEKSNERMVDVDMVNTEYKLLLEFTYGYVYKFVCGRSY